MTAFIADEHIPAPSVETLRAAGFDVLSIREQHPAVSDIEIVRMASAQNRVSLPATVISASSLPSTIGMSVWSGLPSAG